MFDPLQPIMHRLTGQLPGWMFLASGILLIGMTILTPPWLECRQLQWQRNVMRIQAQRLAGQDQAYRQFYQALDDKDPILLERLAYHQLRLKPAGTQNLAAINDIDQRETIEKWLHQPLPRLGVEATAPSQVNTRLARLTTGTMRLPLVVVGVLCVLAGLIWANGSDRS